MKLRSLLKIIVLTTALLAVVSTSEAGKLRRLVYNDIGGSTVADMFGTNLFGEIIFPDKPSGADFIPPANVGSPPFPPFNAETVINSSDPNNYGGWIRGYFTAPESGAYTFWLSTDDECQFYMNTDSTDPLNPAKTNLICWVPGWSGPREWTKYPSQQSSPLTLEGGKTYYLEMFQKEGGGGDHIVIGWTTPSGLVERPMPAWYFQPVRDTRYSEPDVEVVAGPVVPRDQFDPAVYDGMNTVVFANINLDQPATYQWLRNGAVISGATKPYHIFRASLADNGSTWSVQVTSGGTTKTGGPLSLQVYSDNEKPRVVTAGIAPQDPTTIQIVFSEEVKKASAEDLANYTLPTATLQTASLQPDGRTVRIKTALLPADQSHVLTIKNIPDMATPANVMDTVQQTLIPADGFITFRGYYPSANYASDLATLRTWSNPNSTNPVYTNNAFSEERAITSTSFGWNIVPLRDNYTGQMIGYITPPETGDYMFAIASDDHSILYLGTNQLRASKREIANYNGATGRWTLSAQANQRSAAIRLEAGRRYYIEAVYRDGTGGDGVTVAWKKPSDPAFPTTNPGVQAETEPFLIPAANLSPYSVYSAIGLTTNLPATLSAAASTQPTLRVGVEGLLPYYFVWTKNGSPIPGATQASLQLPYLTAADNGSAYQVIVSNNFSSATSQMLTLTVNADTTKPSLASAGSLYRQVVEVRFSEPVTAASAGNPVNYSLSDSAGNPIAVTGTVVDTNDATHVTLQTAAMPETDMIQLVARNIADTSAGANTADAITNTFRAFNFESVVRVNNGQAWRASATGDRINMTAGGADIWGTADQMVFAYKTITGNFDYKVQGVSLPAVNSWCKMGLMARPDISAGARNVFNPFTPVSPGQNTYSAQVRDTTGGASTSSNDAGSPLNGAVQGGVAARPTILPYPSWVRIQRVNDTFHYYYSQNGTNWTYWTYYDSTVSPEGPLPKTLLVGLALTSHDTGRTVDGVMASFVKVDEGALRFTFQPTNTTVVEGGSTTLRTTVAGTTPWIYQWLQQGAPIPDATNATLTLTRVPFTANGNTIAVRVSNMNGQTITSTNAVLTVLQDVEKPTVRFWVMPKVNLTPNEVKLIFSEPMNRTSAETLANYKITSDPGGANLAISGATLDVDDRTVTLTTAAQTAGTLYKVVVNNVTDQACCPANAIAADSTDYYFYSGSSGKFRQRADGFVVMEAESATRVTGTNPARDWELRTIAAGYSGAGYMVVPTVGGTTGGTTISGGVGQGTGPALIFDVIFERPATNYTVWVRGWNQDTATAGNDDSIYVGFDGNLVYLGPTANDVNYSQMTSWGAAGWDWRSDRSTGTDPLVLTNVAAGTHTFIIWQREDGTLIDKVVIEPGVRSNAGNSTEPAVASGNGGLGEPETWDWQVPPPAAPVVTIASPTANQLFPAAANIDIQVTATGATPVQSVEFFNGATLLGTATKAPWTYTWSNVPEGVYRLSVRATDVLGYQVTTPATTITVDSTKPVAYAVGSLSGNGIGVYFNETSGLDPASATAVTNYVVNNGALAVTNAALEPDGVAVMLSLSAPVTGDFTVQIKNVADRGYGPNVMDATTLQSSVVTWLLNQDVGTVNSTNPAAFTDPIRPGYAQAIGTDGFYVRAGGSDIWNNADGMHFVYKEITGDFDVSVRVQSLDRPNEWAKASLMFREDLEGSSRNMMALVAPPPTGSPAGNNLFNAQIRDTKGGATVSLATNQRPTPVPYPDAWLRLTRTNQQFTFSWKTNATANWATLLTTNMPAIAAYPDKVYVGLATTSHSNTDSPANMASAYYRELTGLVPAVTMPVLAAKVTGTDLVITWTSSNPAAVLKSNSDLTSGTWQNVSATPVVNGNNYTVTVPIGAGQLFYRLMLP